MRITVLALLALVVGCASGCNHSVDAVLPQTLPLGRVTVSPAHLAVPAGSEQLFTVQSNLGEGVSKDMTWELIGDGCEGISCGTVTIVDASRARYSAPAVPPVPVVVTLTARSVADSTKSADATITIGDREISMSIAPHGAEVTVGSQTQFVATIVGDTYHMGVQWSLTGVRCHIAPCGVVSPANTQSGEVMTYKAPSTSTDNLFGPITLSATPVADPRRLANVTIKVHDVQKAHL